MKRYTQIQAAIAITIQAFVIALYLLATTNAQKSRTFNPYDSRGQFPLPPWTMLNQGALMPYMNQYPLMRNPLMNRNAFLGGNFNFNPLNSGWNAGTNNVFNPYRNQHQQQQQREELYTAIGYDRVDANSQMRLTITPRSANNRMSGQTFPGMDWEGNDDDYDRPTSWYVQGSFLTSQLKNKAGSYHVVLTKGGRTADGCVGESLGEIVTPDLLDISNPFLQYGVGNQPGIMPNKLLIGSSGPTVYASTLEGISRRQLVGGSIAACEYVNNGVCGGYIPFCGTVSKDVLPAMEVPLANTRTTVTGFNPDIFQGGVGQVGGSVIAFTNSFAATNPGLSSRDEDESRTSASNLGLLF